MAHITQCPACSTRFRVVDDQLKISEGWVRCGRCGEVFDGRQALVAEPPLPPSPAVQVPAAQVPAAQGPAEQGEASFAPLNHAVATPEPDAVQPVLADAESGVDISAGVDLDLGADVDLDVLLPDVAASVDIEIGDDGGLHEAVSPPLAPAELAELADDPLPAAAPSDTAVTAATDAGSGSRTNTNADTSTDTDTNARADADVEWSATVVAVADPLSSTVAASLQAPPEAVAEVSFVRAARRQAFWAQTWVQAVLGVLALVLLIALAAQALWHERDRVAAAAPALKPWLVAACEPLGCEVGHWQHIESIRLEGTALVRLQNGAYRLEVGVNNSAALPVAMPALELSLTNVRDEVVLRRVILAGEWSTPAEVLPPSGSLNLNVNLSVTDSETLHTSGYRALVFYP